MILNNVSAGEGPPLVLLHGLFGATRNLGVLSRGLAAAGAQVVGMDLRNHGDSRQASPMDYPTMAADVAETMTALGIERADIVGHSMGGKTAMALALMQPERVRRLAVLDIAPIAYDHGYDEFVAAMLAIELNPGLTRAAAEQELAQVVKAPAMRAFLLNNLVLGAAPRWRVGLREIQAGMQDILAWGALGDAAPFTKPALFLAGAESDYIGPAAEAAIARQFPAARRKNIAGAAHWLHADKPAEVLAALREFLGL